MKCIKCNQLLSNDDFHFRPDSQTYRASCRNCETTRKSKAASVYVRPEWVKEKSRERQREKARQDRQNENNRARFLLKDSRKSDKKKGYSNTLTLEHIQEALHQDCTYCGDNTTLMTLDRIDNTIGHTIDNVLPCCYRCNNIRGNMPYAAWIEIVPAVKMVFEKGLFNEWTNIGSKCIQAGYEKLKGSGVTSLDTGATCRDFT